MTKQIVNLFRNGLNSDQIASKLNLTVKYVDSVIEDYNNKCIGFICDYK